MPRRFIHRHQPQMNAWAWMKVGLGGALGIGVVALLSELSASPLLIAPFGATAVLVFGVPNSPMAQPANVIGGHLLASAIALGLRALLPPEWWAIGLAVGVSMLAMAIVRLTHPPAGADPIVIFLSDPSWWFLLLPILVSSLLLVALATVFHRLPPREEYPINLHSAPKDAQAFSLNSFRKPDGEL